MCQLRSNDTALVSFRFNPESPVSLQADVQLLAETVDGYGLGLLEITDPYLRVGLFKGLAVRSRSSFAQTSILITGALPVQLETGPKGL